MPTISVICLIFHSMRVMGKSRVSGALKGRRHQGKEFRAACEAIVTGYS